MTAHDVYWMAGLLEGEGYFGNHKPASTPVIQLAMCDGDVIDKFHRLVKATNPVRHTMPRKARRKVHIVALTGPRAVGLMMTVYSLMGQRRKEKIRQVISEWRSKRAKIRGVGEHSRYGKCTACGTQIDRHAVPTIYKTICRPCRTWRSNHVWRNRARGMRSRPRTATAPATQGGLFS